MYLENTSFDAIITDKKGRTLEVDCRVTEPAASGLPASISIEVPLTDMEHAPLENPCSLRGTDGGLEIEIRDLWYRAILAGATRRKHGRGTFDILHAGRLWVRRNHWNSARSRLRFLLSPVRLFKSHARATMVNYASTPAMTAELFKLRSSELGEIRFIKLWSVHHVNQKGVDAEVRASFAAEILCDEVAALPVEQLVQRMRAVLIPLSLLARQAITLHGWVWEKRECIETMWFDPLDPNLAPDMAPEPAHNVCCAAEFDLHAQALVERFLSAPEDIRESVTLLSIALAPHVDRSTAGNVSALFGALEQVIDLEKLTKQERKKLRESDAEVIAALVGLVSRDRDALSPTAASRIEGFANAVRDDGPSFRVRFEKFTGVHSTLATHMTDLWPLLGTTKLPGLKQIRDALAHGLREEHSVQAIAVAHWHFARLAERLTFIVLGAEVPRGLQIGSSLLKHDPWYNRSVWAPLQAAARIGG